MDGGRPPQRLVFGVPGVDEPCWVGLRTGYKAAKVQGLRLGASAVLGAPWPPTNKVEATEREAFV